MPTYHFKRDVKVYVVDQINNRYNIDISEINFSQTFLEESIPAKTLQSLEFFEGARIIKANPANFNFTFPAIRQDDLEIVFDRALDCDYFDLYIETGDEVFKLEKCVITNGTFIIEKLRPLSIDISGQASKLTIPGALSGTPIARDSNRTYNRLTRTEVTVDSSPLDNVSVVQVELVNNIEWAPYVTLQDICDVSAAEEALYPTDYVVKSKFFGGSVVCYLTNVNNADLQTFKTHVPISIQTGENVSGTIYGFDFDMNDCFFKNEIGTGEIYTQAYQWQLTENPSALSDLLTYVTL